ncbi:MAG: hypothetical protein ABIG34_00050 [Candidatus Peregrinibacteria bacterium]
MQELFSEREKELSSNIDRTLRGLSASGGVSIAREQYDEALEAAQPAWIHFSWFDHEGILYWSGNGDTGGDKSQYFQKQLTPDELASLPTKFLLRRLITADDLREEKIHPTPETEEQRRQTRRIVAAALEKAESMPLSALAPR